MLCFTFSWNEFIFASVLTSRDAQPFTVKISSTGTVRGIHFGFVSTRLLMAIIPPLLLSLFVQRYIVRGSDARRRQGLIRRFWLWRYPGRVASA
jgi:multiple sugar transport system permease protein